MTIQQEKSVQRRQSGIRVSHALLQITAGRERAPDLSEGTYMPMRTDLMLARDLEDLHLFINAGRQVCLK